ncbi:MAG TPA: gamma-glutamyl-gamma-aminobutyrate hydrolase family protein [Aestuariivirga sp.]|nr:gamma-glutamyl-gamma-aminobutyrate hydrolase family protein [Aestuariivirga sp.]
MKTVIVITHDRADTSNRCCDWLQRQGYRLEAACPAEGDAIPAIADDTAGAVMFGGKHDVKMKSEHAFLRDELHFIEQVLKADLPFLGICLGGQLLAHALGEDVDLHPEGHAEYGYYDLKPTPEGEAVFGRGLKVLQSHWHGWYDTPTGATRLAYTDAFPEQAFRYGRHAYGMQFHPETTRETLERWIGRRPPERYLLKGTHPPATQLADNLVHDAALGQWFDGFLSGWIGTAAAMQEAAE